MKLSLSFLWTLVIAVSVLAAMGGCTVEKRLYQRGYHVEWHKRTCSTSETGTIAEKQVPDQVILSVEKQTETIAVTPSNEETIAPFEEETSVHLDRVSNTSDAPTVTNTTNSDRSTEILDQTHESKPTLKKMAKREGGPSGVTKGLLMILMGLLLILMGFLFQSILGVFGTILLIIFGLGGTIMIVVGIVFMILG